MSSSHSLVPLGALAAHSRPRGGELRKIRNSLTKIDRNSDHGSVPKRQSLDTSADHLKIMEQRECLEPELRLFSEPDPLSNMVLVVEDVDLHVHKEILAGWSPVFMAMFSSSFIESESGRVVMADKSLDDVRLLLNCLYPPNTHTITENNVMTLLPLIEEYNISTLKTKCEDIILSHEPSLDIILIAHEYNMPRVLEKTIEGCAKLSLSSIDYKTHKTIADHIPHEYIMEIYREKIQQQLEQLKQHKRLKEKVGGLRYKLDCWEKSKNSYPCDKHREFSDNCVQCLKRFREYTLFRLKFWKNLMRNEVS